MEEIRGFLYWDGAHWVVADQPNLKSCCLSKHTPIILQGDFSAYPTDRALHFQGTLSSNGYLLDVAVLEKSHGGFPFFTFGLAVIGSLCVAMFLRRSFKK